MSPRYADVQFDMKGFDPEIWMALLSDWPFESFHEEGDVLHGYIEEINLDEPLLVFLSEAEHVRHGGYSIEMVPDKNWNEVWEQSFSPVSVGHHFYIRAAFHDPAPAEYEHEIIIAPKMAFGTGHHATTYMMLESMAEIDFSGKTVFDFGCGTGILAVASIQLGADRVLGIDIQPEAIENSIEHASLNGVVEKCVFIQGEIDGLVREKVDIILANINSSVILPKLKHLLDKLNPGGTLLLSGIMSGELHTLRNALREHQIRILAEKQKEDWLQLTCRID